MALNNRNLLILAIGFLCYSMVVPQVNAAIKCVQCDSTVENCLKNPAAVETTCDDDKECYVEVGDGGKVTRGCKDQKDGCSADSTTCKTCTSDKCNIHTVCKACDSATDVNCAITNSETFKSAICPAADTKCAIVIDSTKFTTLRRCATADDLTKCQDTANAQTCKACDGANCNTGVFPTNRRRCYGCDLDKSECSDVVANSGTIKSLPCALYKADDQCYTYGESETKMQRGCVSNADSSNKCKDPKNTDCRTCSEDNCNNLKYKNDQRLQCIQCNSKDDTDCSWGQSAKNAANCKNQITYNQEPACYTEKRDGTVYKGCLYDRDLSWNKCEGDNCQTCSNGDGCNNKDVGMFTCIRCRSDETPDCYDNADKVPGSACRNAVTQSTKGCFHGIWNGVVIRGCQVDMNDRMEVVCKDPKNKQCITCDDKADCNSAKTSGAKALMASITVLAMALLTVWNFH